MFSPYGDEVDQGRKDRVAGRESPWMLSCLTRMWDVIAPEGVLSPSSDVPPDDLVMFLDTVRNASSYLAEVKHELSTASRAFVLLARAIATIMLTKIAELSAVLEKPVCLGLLQLAGLSKCVPRSFKAFNEHIIPVLLDIKDADGRFHSFSEDLQVGSGVTLWRARYAELLRSKPSY